MLSADYRGKILVLKLVGEFEKEHGIPLPHNVPSTIQDPAYTSPTSLASSFAIESPLPRDAHLARDGLLI